MKVACRGVTSYQWPQDSGCHLSTVLPELFSCLVGSLRTGFPAFMPSHSSPVINYEPHHQRARSFTTRWFLCLCVCLLRVSTTTVCVHALACCACLIQCARVRVRVCTCLPAHVHANLCYIVCVFRVPLCVVLFLFPSCLTTWAADCVWCYGPVVVIKLVCVCVCVCVCACMHVCVLCCTVVMWLCACMRAQFFQGF